MISGKPAEKFQMEPHLIRVLEDDVPVESDKNLGFAVKFKEGNLR